MNSHGCLNLHKEQCITFGCKSQGGQFLLNTFLEKQIQK